MWAAVARSRASPAPVVHCPYRRRPRRNVLARVSTSEFAAARTDKAPSPPAARSTISVYRQIGGGFVSMSSSLCC